MADNPTGKWSVVLNVKGDLSAEQQILFDSPNGAQVSDSSINVDLQQPFRAVSRALTLAGEPSKPKMVRVTSTDASGSIIMALMTTQNQTINQWVIEGMKTEFVLVPTPAKEIVLSFRLYGQVRFCTPAIEIEDLSAEKAVEWMLAQFEIPALRRRKGYLEHYVDYMLTSGCDLKKPGFMEFLFGQEKYEEIIRIAGGSLEQQDVRDFRNRALLCVTINHPNDIKMRLEEAGIKSYRVALINSGIGDILTTGNLSSYLCERFGLNFAGVHKAFRGQSKREYYDETFHSIPEPTKLPRTLIFSVSDIADDMDRLIETINGAAPGQYEELCLIPTTPSSFSRSMKHSKLVCQDFVNNQFNRYIKARTAIMPHRYPQKTVLIHARLGDVAPIIFGDWCINLYDLLRGNQSEGLVALGSGSRSQTMRSLTNFQSLGGFMSYLREVEGPLHIIFISDGFDLTKKLLANPDLHGKITSAIPGLTIQSLEESIKSMERTIEALPADQMQVGEKTIDDFYNSVALILSSDVIISTARSFVFNCLANFKYGDRAQHFFSPVTGGYFDVLLTRGCVIHQFSEFIPAKSDIAKCLREFTRREGELVNITAHCATVGGTVDHDAGNSSESTEGAMGPHGPLRSTSVEEGAHSLVIDLRVPIKLSTIELTLSELNYPGTRPFTIDWSVDGMSWTRMFLCDFGRPAISVDATGLVARFIRIENQGPGNIPISNWQVFVESGTLDGYLDSIGVPHQNETSSDQD